MSDELENPMPPSPRMNPLFSPRCWSAFRWQKALGLTGRTTRLPMYTSCPNLGEASNKFMH
jgi:hypothetical protein